MDSDHARIEIAPIENAGYSGDLPAVQQAEKLVRLDMENQVATPIGDGAEDGQMQTSAATTRRQLHIFRRNHTLLPNAEFEQQLGNRQYLIRRPRALQYYIGNTFVNADGKHKGPTDVEILSRNQSRDEEDATLIEQRTTDAPVILRARLDLFIDLVWVAVVSNISETFSSTAFSGEASNGYALLQFVTLFFLSFRIWDQLRSFLNNYFNGDILQGLLVLWVLILALAFGNNTIDPVEDGHLKYLIFIVIITKATFFGVETIYAILVEELRKGYFLQVSLIAPSALLLVASLWVKWPYTPALILPAMFIESLTPALIESPIGAALIGKAVRKALDADHFINRLEGFFLIIVGEGIFLLIKNGPLGINVSDQFEAGATALVIYYIIAQLYFNGDHTKTYIHAVKRNKYGASIFLFLHMVLFASLLIFDAGILYLIQHTTGSAVPETAGDPTVSERADSEPTADDEPSFQHAARWVTSTAICVVFLSMTAIALLHKPLKHARSQALRIKSRYLRLAPRSGCIVIFACLPLSEGMNSNTYMGILAVLIIGVALWEYVAGADAGGKTLEPK